MANPQISLVIITLNEEPNIERCIRSVPFASDIVVLDSGSEDQTVSLARKLQARTYIEKWRGYRDQKARAAELAEHDWVLSLDADEALSPEAIEEIDKILKSGGVDKYDGYEFPRLSRHMGRWIRHGGWYPDRQLRLFSRKRASWGAGHVHERVQAQRVKRLSAPIYHWPFPTLAEQINTNNNYSSLGARDLFDRGKRFSIFKLLVKPCSKFIETYILKRGFLDGLPGFIIAVGAAYSVFLKFSKLHELENRDKWRVDERPE